MDLPRYFIRFLTVMGHVLSSYVCNPPCILSNLDSTCLSGGQHEIINSWEGRNTTPGQVLTKSLYFSLVKSTGYSLFSSDQIQVASTQLSAIRLETTAERRVIMNLQDNKFCKSSTNTPQKCFQSLFLRKKSKSL